MVRQFDPRLQASGRRYLGRRLERALMYGDPRGGPDAPRLPSFWVAGGALLAGLAVIAGMLLPLIRPGTDLGDARIVLDRRSAGLYVRVEQTWHPVLNLTSAWLITGQATEPRQVDRSALVGVEHGAVLGIPGAPDGIGAPLDESESGWTVCDGAETTVVAGQSEPPVALPEDRAVLVSGPSGTPYLLYAGTRAMVDLRDRAVIRALRLDGVMPKPVSATLLNTVPEVAPLLVPRIPGLGGPGPDRLPGSRVGEVIAVQISSGTSYFVVLAGGVQPVGEIAADLIRFAGHRGADEIPVLPPDAVAAVPSVGSLPLTTYPERSAAVEPAEIVCASWMDGAVTVSTGSTVPLPAGRSTVRLAQGDADGPAVDAVSIPAGRSLYVRPERGPDGYLVTDTGVRFPVEDDDSAKALGLPDNAVVAPSAILSALPAGPVLGRAAASVLRDVGSAPTVSGQG